MQVNDTAMYRVKAVAGLLDVHPATIYRAVESGELSALRIKGAVRIPGKALADYLAACGAAPVASAAAAQDEGVV